MTKPKSAPDDPEQFARFKQAAKRPEIDETGEAFERAVKKIVPVKEASNASSKLAGIPGLTLMPPRTGRSVLIGGQSPAKPSKD